MFYISTYLPKFNQFFPEFQKLSSISMMGVAYKKTRSIQYYVLPLSVNHVYMYYVNINSFWYIELF